ncbi:MAG: PEP/pyruvate-binding domain-containing protein [Vicinamibacterales bacterium]
MSPLVWLGDAEHEAHFGGKAVSLGAAIRAGLPVPGGLAIAAPHVDRIAAGDRAALDLVLTHTHLPGGRMAVRSSAVGEDSSAASFAGQHQTVLNVRRDGLAPAIAAVWASGRSEAALAYRRKQGLPPEPAVGVVVQALVEPLAAGVLFTRHPVTGARERVIEAAWGLGEVVVSGAVTPDAYRVSPDGVVLDAIAGFKDVRVWYADDGHGTETQALPEDHHERLCLTEAHLIALHDLAARCERVYGPDLDLEWAVDAHGAVHLLQARPITAGAR